MTPSRDSDKWPLVNFRAFSPEAHQALADRAREAGVSISQMVRRWIAERLEPEVHEK